jgi:tetratricopeptide (TPR) repeat protein
MVKPMKAEMDRSVELEPGFAAAHYVLSLLYWKVPGRPLSIGDKAKALEEGKLAVKLAPDNTQYRLGLGEAYLALKDRTAAKREFQAVLAMTPTPDDPVQSALDKKDAQEYLNDLK